MTWRELSEKIRQLSDEQIDTDVTIFDRNPGEFMPSSAFSTNDGSDWTDVLDKGHPYLEIN